MIILKAIILVITITLITLVIYFPKEYYVTKGFTYPNNKKAAYISSWDDTSNISSFEKIANITNPKNIPLTLFISTKHLNDSNINRYKKLLRNNNVIESHTVSHVKSKYNDNSEYIESQKQIQQLFGNKYGKTICYPFGKYPSNKETQNIINKIYLAGRSIKYGCMKKDSNLYRLPVIPIEKMNTDIIEEAILNNYTIITYGHGIKGIGGWIPIEEDKFKCHIKELCKYKNDIWFTTLPELMLYLKRTKQINN